MSAPQATILVVARHGETVWNILGKEQGQTDTDLSELGVRQAQAIADGLAAARPFDALYASDLRRAVQTAELIGGRLSLPVRTDPRLRERHLGLLQGLTKAEFRQQYPEAYARFSAHDPDYVLPGGESARQRHERAIAGAEEIARRHAGGRVVIVTHSGVLQSFFRHALGLPVAGPRRFSLLNASLNRFAVTAGQWQLETWGETGHLGSLATLDDT